MTDETTGTAKQYACPECAAAGKNTSYDYGNALGNHRLRVHGIRGTSKSVLAARRKKGKPLGRPKGSGKKEGTAAEARARQAASTNMLVGYAMRGLEELAAAIARENHLPEREFTALVAERLAERMAQ